MNWKDLLSDEREITNSSIGVKKEIEGDSFLFDYSKITQSSSVRRLQDKTQVFPLEKNDFVRTRLTHSLEVSSIAETIGVLIAKELNISLCKTFHLTKEKPVQHFKKLKGDHFEFQYKDLSVKVNSKDILSSNIFEIPKILKCAGLIHDLGNPPFGHYSEAVIRNWFSKNLDKLKCKGQFIFNEDKNPTLIDEKYVNDFLNFDGNAQSIRILTKLQNHEGKNGLNLTYPVLSCISKYTVQNDKIDKKIIWSKKIGYFQSENEIVNKIAEKLGTQKENGTISRHPLAYILEAADDIAYRLGDIEDAYKKGFYSSKTLKENLLSGLNDYRKSYTKDQVAKTEHLITLLVDDDDNLNEWIHVVKVYLMNAVVYSFFKNYKQIMNGNYNNDLFSGTFHELTMKLLKEIFKKLIVSDRKLRFIEQSSGQIIEYYLDLFVPLVITYDFVDEQNNTDQENKLIQKMSNNFIKIMIDRIIEIETDDVLSDDQKQSQIIYAKIQMVIDYISGMTDTFAYELIKNT